MSTIFTTSFDVRLDKPCECGRWPMVREKIPENGMRKYQVYCSVCQMATRYYALKGSAVNAWKEGKRVDVR